MRKLKWMALEDCLQSLKPQELWFQMCHSPPICNSIIKSSKLRQGTLPAFWIFLATRINKINNSNQMIFGLWTNNSTNNSKLNLNYKVTYLGEWRWTIQIKFKCSFLIKYSKTCNLSAIMHLVLLIVEFPSLYSSKLL